MKVEKYLLEKGIKPHLKGFEYLAQAIQLCTKDRSLLRKITTGLYPTLASTNNDTYSRVERAIRNAINVSGKKMTNSQFIATAVIELEN